MENGTDFSLGILVPLPPIVNLPLLHDHVHSSTIGTVVLNIGSFGK